MKKSIITFFLIFTILLSLSACTQEAYDTSPERKDAETQASEPASAQIDEQNNEWNLKHFQHFGLDDMTEMPLLEITSYDYDGEKEITIIWEEATDFDAVTEYAADLFNKTAAKHGGNYVATVEDNKWVLGQEIPSFQDACTSWESLEYYCAIWTYAYNGKVIDITIHGEIGDEVYNIDGFTMLTVRVLS